MPEWLDDPLKIVTAAIALAGLAFTWRKFREESLRRSEVLAWADEAIAALQGLVMVCILRAYPAFAAEADKRLAAIAFDTSILVERGRIFFRNQKRGEFGKDKKPAYRGVRPLVLDPLIAAHQIAVRIPGSEGEQLTRLQCLAEEYLKDFVSLMQVEVGRQKTASQATQIGGSGFNLERELAKVPDDKVALVTEMVAKEQAAYRAGAIGGGALRTKTAPRSRRR